MMRRILESILEILICVALAAATWAIMAWAMYPASGAPVPFARTCRQARLDLQGEWDVSWGGAPCQFSLRGNAYLCRWFGRKYRGWWGIEFPGQGLGQGYQLEALEPGEVRLWITESPEPERSDSWQTYAVRMDAATLEGVSELGGKFRLMLRKRK